MPMLLLKDLPRFECLLEAAKKFPDLDPTACEAYLHLMRTSDDSFRCMEPYFNAHGMSPGRFTVLMLLLDKINNCPKSHTPAELADMSAVTRATMTGLIDTLERDGFVKREPDPDDRRMMSVNLTPKGQGSLNDFLPGHFKRMAELMAPLSEDERKTLVRLLTKIATNAVSLSGSNPAVAAETVS